MKAVINKEDETIVLNEAINLLQYIHLHIILFIYCYVCARSDRNSSHWLITPF